MFGTSFDLFWLKVRGFMPIWAHGARFEAYLGLGYAVLGLFCVSVQGFGLILA